MDTVLLLLFYRNIVSFSRQSSTVRDVDLLPSNENSIVVVTESLMLTIGSVVIISRLLPLTETQQRLVRVVRY